MKAILAVVAVLLAVTHLGDTHGDHTHPHPPFLPVRLANFTYHVSEGDSTNVTVRTIGTHSFNFTVFLIIKDGGDDFDHTNITVNFPAGQDVFVTVPISTKDDDIVEALENFTLYIQVEHDAFHLGVVQLESGTIFLEDNDSGTVSFSPQNYSIPEGTVAEINIVLDKAFATDLRFEVVTTDGTATSPSDYTGGRYLVTIPALKKEGKVSVFTNKSVALEDDEYFKATLNVPQHPRLSTGLTTAVITINDRTIPVEFEQATYHVTEGSEANVTITLRTLAQRDYPFDVVVSTRSGSAGGADFQDEHYMVHFPDQAKEAGFTVTIFDDDIAECPEEFFLKLMIPPNADRMGVIKGDLSNAKVVINDTDFLVSLRNDSNKEVIYDVKEGVNHTCVTLKAFGANIETAFDVTVVVKDGSATYPSDYAAREVTATFLPGETTANACIPIVDDDVNECLEWFTLELSLTQAAVDLCAVLSSPFTARVRIEDNDVVSIDFDPLTYNIAEGYLGEIHFFLNRISQTSISFIVMVMDGTADGSDYVGGNFPATIHAGMKNVTLPLVTKGDAVIESTEFLSVVIKPNPTPPNCSDVVAGPPANVSIIDGTVPVKFSASVYHVCTVRGRPSSVAITLEATKDHKFDFTVKVHIKDGTAKRNSDYDDGPLITKRFRIQQRIVTIPISIIAGGDMVEPPENFTVELEIPLETKYRGVVAVEPSTAEIVITDVPIGTFTPQNYTVREGEAARLTIALDRPSMQDMIFNVATISITATTFDDYFRHNYNVTVPAGAIEATTTVVTTRNAKIEAEEHFKAIVHPLVKCNLEDRENTAYITITDCTVLVTFSSTVYTATEGLDPKVTITVLANGAVEDSDFSIRVIAKDGTATSGEDYVIKDTLLLFKRGETEHRFSINITDDVLAEPHEVFTLELARPQQGSTVCIARGTPDIAHVRLADDDVVTVSFSPQNYTVSEGIPANIRMLLDKEASESITVFVTTMDITTGSADYVQENGTPVTFTPGTREDSLSLLTLRDTVINEPNEYLKVTLDLEPTTVQVEIGLDPCFVTITDATVGVQFRSAMYMVGEGDGNVTVTVEASKEHVDFNFVIKMVAQDGTAETESDLHEQEITVTFPAGKTTVEASIGINDDEIAESLEIFHLVLEIPDKATGSGVVAIAPNTTEIKIIDNDECQVQGEEYFDGVDSCVPCTGTCEEPTKVCTLECRRGCGCPVGTVLDEEANACVNVTDCPKDPSCPQECSHGFCRSEGPNAECSVPGSTGPACTGACHVTKCRACYYSKEVHNCPVGCRYACGEDPNGKCFQKWSRCVKDGLGKMAGRKRANRFKCVDPCTC